MNETTAQGLNRGLIQAFDSTALANNLSSRLEAIHAFRKSGLPGAKAEEYRFTPLAKTLEKKFAAEDFFTSAKGSIDNVDQFLVAGYSAHRIVFINGVYQPSLSDVSDDAGFTITSLQDTVAASEYFTHLAKASTDPFVALNTALWQGGIAIEVDDNVSVARPILILHLSDASSSRVVSQSRLLVVLGKGSEISMVEKYDSLGSNPVFTSSVAEIAVGENATLNYHKIQNDKGEIYHAGTTQIHQETGSKVNTFTLTLDGRIIRNNLNIIVDGEGCESHFFGLYLLQNNTLADNHTVVDHQKPNSFSNELYKGIMDDTAKGVFNGKIYVRPHAQKTNAFQSNRNILLSDSATVNTKPQLEIWADDVKCSHGCTSGQLDEEALFYLQSRGISRSTARAMVLYAFAGEVIAGIKDPRLKAYMDTLVSERLQKNL